MNALEDLDNLIGGILEISALSGLSGRFSVHVKAVATLSDQAVKIKDLLSPGVALLAKKYSQLSPSVDLVLISRKNSLLSVLITCGAEEVFSFSFFNERFVKNSLFLLEVKK